MGLGWSLVRDSIVGFRVRSHHCMSTPKSALQRSADQTSSSYSTCSKVTRKLCHSTVSHFTELLFRVSSDNLVTARSTFGSTFILARAAALVLHVDIAFILLPICRGFVSRLRRSTLNELVPFEKNIEFRRSSLTLYGFGSERKQGYSRIERFDKYR